MVTFHALVHSVALHGFEACVFDQRDDLLAAHLDLVVRFNRIALRKLASLGNRTVEIVCAVVQGHLGQTLSQHYPVSLDVIKVVEHQT